MRLVRGSPSASCSAPASVLLGSPVSAHAELISVSPADGEVLDAAPAGGRAHVQRAGVADRRVGARARRRRDGRLDGNDAGERDDHDHACRRAWPTAPTPSSSRSSPSTRTASGAPRCSTSVRRRRQGSTGDDLDLGWRRGRLGRSRAAATALSAIAYTGALVAAGTLCVLAVRRPARRRCVAVTSRAAVLGAVALVAAVPFRIARLGGGLDALRDNDVLMAALRGPVGVSTAVTANALLVVAVLVDRRAPAVAGAAVRRRRPRPASPSKDTPGRPSGAG